MPARAQSSADALLGCYSQEPGGPLWFSIDRRGGRLGATWSKTGRRYILAPATGDEEREVADEMELSRFPGVTIVAGLTDDDGYGYATYVVLSSPLSWGGRRTQFATYDYEFGLAPMFKVNCP